MRLTVRVLGLELLSIEASTDDEPGDGPGDCISNPVGFVQSPGDQRWEKGVEASS